MLFRRHYSLFTAPVLLLLGCQPLVTTFDDIETAVDYEAVSIGDVPDTADTLLVMTWNIKFGGGDIDFWFDCWGDRVLMTKDEVLDNLERVVAKIIQVAPDVLLLQEVDVDSKRSAYLDQLQYILDSTDLNYGVYAAAWQVQFIPSDGLGRMNSGNAILSRWPLSNTERISLPLRTDQDALTRYFYLRRNILRATVELPGYDSFVVVNVHTAAYSRDGTKQKHIDRFKEELDKTAGEGGLFVAAGDLNTIPPGSVKDHDFPDAVCEDEAFIGDDYRDELMPGEEWLKGLYASYASAIPLTDYQADNVPYLTFSANPTIPHGRKLDYLFTNRPGGWVPGSAVTHQDILFEGRALSDHAPVSVKLVLP